MSESSGQAPASLVGRGGCLVLGSAFALFALFELAVAQMVEQPGVFGEVAGVVPWAAFVSAVFAIVERRRLRRAHRALWLSAACLAAWALVTWLATLGP